MSGLMAVRGVCLDVKASEVWPYKTMINSEKALQILRDTYDAQTNLTGSKFILKYANYVEKPMNFKPESKPSWKDNPYGLK